MSNRPLRIEWLRIKEVYPTDYYVLCLMSKRASNVILSMMHILEYEATFRTSGYDFSDWDALQHILSEADREIGDAMPLTELIGYIDEVEELLRALQYTANCCDNSDITDGDGFTNPINDGVGDVPQEIIDAGYATGISDWAGFDDYKCMISYLVVDDLEAKLRKFAPYVDSAGVIIGGIATIASIVTTIFTSGLSAIALGIIATTGSTALFYKLVTDGSILEGIADNVASAREALACAVYLADGSSAAHDALNAELDAQLDPISSTIAKTMNLGPTLKALYGGRHDAQNIAQKVADAGYTPASFDCACLGEPVPQVGCLTGLLHNCGFEDGVLAPWVQSGNPAPAVVAGAAHDGSFGFGGADVDAHTWIRQDFTAPVNATNIEVSWWIQQSTNLEVFVNGASIYDLQDLNSNPAWRQQTKNITAMITAGDEIGIKLRFTAKWDIDSINVVLS